MSAASFSWPVRVYYEDTDAGGVVFYANYLKFFERARTEWLRTVNLESSILLERYGALFVIKASNVEYHASARLDDELQVTAAVEKVGRASLVFYQEVRRGEQVLTSARITACWVDKAAWRPVAIPNEMVASLRGVVQS